MKEIIKKYLCTKCLNKSNCFSCMKYTEKKEKGVYIYMCENYKGQKKQKEDMEYIKYTFYDEDGKYIAIIKEETPESKIKKLKYFYDEVKYKE